jgi:hypothetical protein
VIVAAIIGVSALVESSRETAPTPGVEREAPRQETVGERNIRLLPLRAERLARNQCSASTISQLAREYGGDPSDPSSVANAFSRTFQPDARPYAEAGCLEGLGR